MTDPIPRTQIYKYCPRCGADSFGIHDAHLTACPKCRLKLYHNTCSGVGALLVDSLNRVLLVRRSREPGKGKLAFPGGFVDNGESAEQALQREIKEEIGIDVTSFTYLCSMPNDYPYAGVIYPALDVFFCAQVPDFGSARPLDDVEELVFLTTHELELEDLAFPSTKAAWKAFRSTVRDREN